MSFCIDDQKLLGNHKAIWIKIEDLKSIELNALPVYVLPVFTTIKAYGVLINFILTLVA